MEDFLFFAKTLIFEEIVDRYNRVRAATTRLHPLSRVINDNHHFEEARHLVFGRRAGAALWDRLRAGRGDAGASPTIRNYLGSFLVATWREYYNPDVYADAGSGRPVGRGGDGVVRARPARAPAQRLGGRAPSS